MCLCIKKPSPRQKVSRKPYVLQHIRGARERYSVNVSHIAVGYCFIDVNSLTLHPTPSGTIFNSDSMKPTDMHRLLAQAGTRYNLHSHTQFCDGRAPMEVMAQAACDAGMLVWGFSPHSPVPNAAEGFGPQSTAARFPTPSPCNMRADSVPAYLAEAQRLKELYDGRMTVLTGMEIDFFGPEWGAHSEWYQRLPLDYRIGSIHFVPTQDGRLVDCDGSAKTFRANLESCFNNDLRYVVEKYFEQQLTMLGLGGFDILAHCDKIAANASSVDPDIESRQWFRALVHATVRAAAAAGVTVEINTKSLADRGRFFPAAQWWEEFKAAGCPLIVNSDAHYPDRVDNGRHEALELLFGCAILLGENSQGTRAFPEDQF